MSSILSLSSAQVQTIFAEEMTITDGLSESENSDVIENENLQIEDQTETVDADNETIPDCIENQEVEVLQNDSEFSDGASENTEGLKEFSENNTRVTQSEYNGFLYDITDENEVTITGYDGDVENGLIIPDTIQDYPVTEIGDSAFAGKDIKGELKLPEKLKRIGEYAFSGCYNLTGNLEFPSTLKQIGRDAFKGCSGFTGNLILPEGLKTIGEEAFYRCTGYYYDEEEEENDKGLSGKLTLPSTVTDIGDNAFNSGSSFDVTESGYINCNRYFTRVENYSNTPLNMNQIMGDWYDLQGQKMFTESDNYLINSTAVFVPYLMNIAGTPDYVRVGEKRKINYMFYPEKLDAECPLFVKFSSSDSSVVSVDEQGYIISKKPGKATITATDLTGRSDSESITVVETKAEVKKGNIIWYIPEEIGLGYQIGTLRSESCGGISIAKVINLPSDTIGKKLHFNTDSSKWGYGDDYHFTGPHAGDMDSTIYDTSAAFVHAYYDTATYPGTVSFRLKLGEDTTQGWVDSQIVGDVYKIKIKTPTITVNAPSTGVVGDSFTLTSTLQDTALKNELISKYIIGNRFYHTLVYQPTFEIIQGADLVACSDGNFSHMLTATEKISFKKAGTVKIRIKYNPVFLCNWCEENGRESYYVPEKTITLKIKPATTLGTVKLGTVKSAGYNKLSLTWSAVPDATGYSVFRKNGNHWEKIATTSENSYKHISSKKFPIKTGVTYMYTVRAYRKSGKSIIYGNYDKNGMKGKTVAEKPVLTSISSPAYNQVKITWKKATGATGYIVYRKNSKDRWERLAVLKGNMTSYTQTSSKDFPIVLGRTYTYTVRSYTSTEKTYGLYDSSGKKIQVTLAAPQLETVKSVSSGLKIQWKKVAGASAYVVYRCENGKWELLTRTKRLYYIDSKAQKGITYRYAVKAYSTVDRKNIYSSKSNTKSGRY